MVNWSNSGLRYYELFRWDQLGPRTFGEVAGRTFLPDGTPGLNIGPITEAELSISECPGDFNPQTFCLTKGYGVGSVGIVPATSKRDLVLSSLGYCEVQGGKTYYLNKCVIQCMGASVCSNSAYSADGGSIFYDPGYWNNKSSCDSLVRTSLRDTNGNIIESEPLMWCRAWGHVQ